MTLVVFVTLILLVLPSTAAAEEQLVGSWDCSADGFIVTVNKDGTYMSSNPTAAESASHGAWERSGGATFDLTDLAFVYDENGEIAYTEQARVRAEVDGDTMTGVPHQVSPMSGAGAS